MDLMAGFGHALDLTSRLKRLNDKLKDAEFADVLADLQLELARLKSELAGTIEENVQLKGKMQQLKQRPPVDQLEAPPYETEPAAPDFDEIERGLDAAQLAGMKAFAAANTKWLSAHDLARRTRSTGLAADQFIDRLMQKGLVSDVHGPNGHDFSLTPLGRDFVLSRDWYQTTAARRR